MENTTKLEPFVKTLPVGSGDYFKILDESETRSMRSGLVTLKPGPG